MINLNKQMKENYNDSYYDQLKEAGDSRRLNNDPEKNYLYEGIGKMGQIENNLTGKIEDPPSLSGSTGSSENKKNSETNQEKIESKNVKITPKKNEKKMNVNFISIKVKIDPTPKENEKKINEDSIEKKKEGIFQNKVKSSENNMNLLGYKETVESFNMLNDSDSDGDMKIENNDYKGQRIKGNSIGANQNKPEINFPIVASIRNNQGIGGEDYKIKDENNPSNNFPKEKSDELNSSDLGRIVNIERNHPHH